MRGAIGSLSQVGEFWLESARTVRAGFAQIFLQSGPNPSGSGLMFGTAANFAMD